MVPWYRWIGPPSVILGIIDTHLTFGPHVQNTIERVTRYLSVLKVLSGINWGFPKETLVKTYKAMVRLILNYGAPIWRHQVYPTCGNLVARCVLDDLVSSRTQR